jgi:tetratricopeptide (TPR) repeat protein
MTLLVLVAVGYGAWYAWRWHTTPVPPTVSLDGADPAVVAAIEQARREVLRSPRSIAAWARLARVLRTTGYRDAAAACYAQAERFDPADPRWPYLRGESLQLYEADAAIAHLQRAVTLADQSDRDNPAPRLRLAEVLLARGRYEEAEPLLRRAREIDPENPNLALDLALAAYARDDLEESRTWLTRCQDSPLTRKKAGLQLAAVLRRQRDPSATEVERRARALPADRNWVDPYLAEQGPLQISSTNRLQRVEHLENEGRYAEAVQVLEGMVADEPDYPVYVALGRNYMHLRDDRRSEEALRQALALAPERIPGRYLLGTVLFARAEKNSQAGATAQAEPLYQEAADHARRVLAQKPDHAGAYLLLGRSCDRLGRSVEAIAALNRAVACDPDLFEAYLFLGEALAKAGRPTEAKRHLERAAQLAPPNEQRPQHALARLGPSQ